jgi:hypothetical protein
VAVNALLSGGDKYKERLAVNKQRTHRFCMKRFHLSYNFPIKSALKQDVLLPVLFNFTLEYTIRKVQENQVKLKLNGTHQLLVYADYVNLLGDNIDAIKKST